MRAILEQCSSKMPEREFAAGETVLSEGQRVGLLFVLIEGSVEILKGDLQINVVSEPGAIFGEMSVLLDTSHTATVRTLVPSRFYVADTPLEFLQSCPEIAIGVSKLLAARLHSMTTYLVDLKQQFEEQGDHLAMVDEVLETLIHAQAPEHTPGSDRDPDPTVY